MEAKKVLSWIFFLSILVWGFTHTGMVGCGSVSSPPAGIPAPVSNLMTVSNPDSNGEVTVTGSPGSVESGATVSAGNISEGGMVWRLEKLWIGTAHAQDAGVTAMVIANADGSFRLVIKGKVGEIIRVIQIVNGQLSTPTDLAVAEDTIALNFPPRDVAMHEPLHIAFVTGADESAGLVVSLNLASGTTLLSFPDPTLSFPGRTGITGITMDPDAGKGLVISPTENTLISFPLASPSSFTVRPITAPQAIDSWPNQQRSAVGVAGATASLFAFDDAVNNFFEPCFFLITEPGGKTPHQSTPFVDVEDDNPVGPMQIIAASQFADGVWVVSRVLFHDTCSTGFSPDKQVVLPSGVTPGGLVSFKKSDSALVTNSAGHEVLVIDLFNQVVANTIQVGNGPKGVAVDLIDNKAYVVNSVDNSVTSINLSNFATNTVGSVGLAPSEIAIDSNTHQAVILSQIDQAAVILDLDF